jgi:cellulose synthase/poly-beta-1,6-N-acetylglucosamine synthase-like glycosyltransferase
VIPQVALVVGYLRVLGCRRQPSLSDEQCPLVAVILSLRGDDPFLSDCLRALLHQNYPRYEVHIVLDHPDDPAWPVVQAVLQSEAPSHVRVHTLTERRDTCSLKCSSLVQVVSQLDEACEVVAQTDADTIVHPDWLRELVTPLADERIGAATGNRWYVPTEATWGALARGLWNAAAVIIMYWFKIAWGGTLAIKTRVLREAGLLERWSRALCEDTLVYRELRRLGMDIAFVPSLMMVNRESCTMPGYLEWCRRQLFNTRLYHPAWPVIMFHGIGTFLTPAAALLLTFAACVTAQWSAVLWAGGGFAFYQLAYILLFIAIEVGVRRIAESRGETVGQWTPSRLVKLVSAIPVTQVIYPIILLSTVLVRHIQWRGVTYQVTGPWQVRLVEYRPYPQHTWSAHPHTSR